MKKNILFVNLLLLMLCSSCNKNVKQFLGDYSYKISGEVAITDGDGTTTYRLIHKTGQMNVLKDNTSKSGDKVLVTMNEMNGSAYTIHATICGDAIEFDTYSFNTNILSAGSSSIFSSDNNSLVYRISASGSGGLSGDMLMVEEKWNGCQSGNSKVTLSGPKMTLLAERN